MEASLPRRFIAPARDREQYSRAQGAMTSSPTTFRGRAGYETVFLNGWDVPLPATTKLADDVLPVPGSDGDRLDYEHFSIVMSKSRRLGFANYRATDEAFFDLFARLRQDRLIP